MEAILWIIGVVIYLVLAVWTFAIVGDVSKKYRSKLTSENAVKRYDYLGRPIIFKGPATNITAALACIVFWPVVSIALYIFVIVAYNTAKKVES